MPARSPIRIRAVSPTGGGTSYDGRVTELALSSSDPARLATDALVIGITPDGTGARLLGADALPGPVRAALESAIGVLGLKGTVDEVTKIPAGDGVKASLLVLTGLGAVASGKKSEGAPTLENLRRAAGAATRQLAGTTAVALVLPADDAAQTSAVAEGALLGAYTFGDYRGTRAGAVAPVATITLVTPTARTRAAKDAVVRARVLAAAVHGTRNLVNAAPNDLYPQTFADHARASVKGTKVKITVLDDAALREGGYGGLIGVGQGSVRPPRLVKLTYAPARVKKHYALVGKGITFDSGGLSIKPAKSMETMKSDMAGAAAVLNTVLAAAELGLPIKVTGWLALAENMPSGTAQRPSDVITIRGGKTVEVLNTDAEGRLVLADAIVAAGEEKPDAIIDIATLTGAQMIALGNQVSAVMGSDDVRGAVIGAAERSGEQFWPMPLPEELRASMKTPMADLANMGERYGGMLVAGLFLQEFAGSTPWAHLDIAGPSFNEGGPRHYVPKGGTGVGVRTLLSLLEDAAGA
ncbi:leucyl aminopeptidase [Ruania sp. N2-46]|uniref:Probable cytosol aminopeptidase n=1 Tax=Occultella gossypii TaxID=2800820 RepID=A0ABS7S5I3_9MICO|nr:leucyl aminopeptidase [Occultella gossypii]